MISEGPDASADTTGRDLRAAAAQAADFAATVRGETRRMSLEAQRVLDAQSDALLSLNARPLAPVAGFFSLRHARSDSEPVSSMFHSASEHTGRAHVGFSPTDGGDATPEMESSVRKLLLDAGKKFADAAGAGQSFPSSFLQPVDANRLRKSLRATEPMRSPSPMTVNVVTAEDVPALRREAIYKGLAAQTVALHNGFEADVAALGAL